MKAGFCHYHKYTLTFRQMRNHKCLQKNGTWCKRFEPNINHPYWIDRLQRRSKQVGKPYIKKMKKKANKANNAKKRKESE